MTLYIYKTFDSDTYREFLTLDKDLWNPKFTIAEPRTGAEDPDIVDVWWSSEEKIDYERLTSKANEGYLVYVRRFSPSGWLTEDVYLKKSSKPALFDSSPMRSHRVTFYRGMDEATFVVPTIIEDFSDGRSGVFWPYPHEKDLYDKVMADPEAALAPYRVSGGMDAFWSDDE